jgi:hypothetical protein
MFLAVSIVLTVTSFFSFMVYYNAIKRAPTAEIMVGAFVWSAVAWLTMLLGALGIILAATGHS